MKRFKYDSDKLDFIESRFSPLRLVRMILLILLASVLLSFIYYVLIAVLFDTRAEKSMKLEKKAIDEEYAEMKEKLYILENSVNDMTERDKNLYFQIFNTVPFSFAEEMESENLLDVFPGESHPDIVDFVSLDFEEVTEKICYVEELIAQIQKDLQGTDVKKIPSILPVSDFSIRQTGASVGRKIHPFYKTLLPHNGIDIVTTIGTDVLATADGVVIAVKESEKGLGNRITIDHRNGYVTTYSHLRDIKVKKGMRVKRGKKIATVGISGTAFAPHLHYEVMLNGVYQEPINYFFCDLTPGLYLEMIKISRNTGQSLD